MMWSDDYRSSDGFVYSQAMEHGDLNDQTILITGTSSGYGKAIAGLFLARGWNVIATMRRPDASVFATSSDRLLVLPLDVTKAETIDKAIADGVAAFGAIDVLVNNAGIGMARPSK